LQQLTHIRRVNDERGIAMVMVVLITAMLLLLSGVMIDVVQSDSTRSNTTVQRGTALAAAEAGIDNYLSKLVDDNQYYLHDVAAGESTRQSGATVVSSSCSPSPTPAAWTGQGSTWTYPNGKDQWCSLGNGYEFNLQVTGPSAGSQVVDIVATGRKTGTTKNYRILEEQVRPSSVADFLMLTNSNYNVGATATTYGKIYAGENSTGTVKYNINHQGTAYGNLYAEGSITGNPTLAGTPPAQEYTGSAGTIRSVIKTPINFSNFTTSLTDIRRAADLNLVAGQKVYDLNNSNYDVWKLTFNSAGTLNIAGCKDSGSNNPEDVKPTSCTTVSTNLPIPTNGAIYAQQSVMISDGTSTCGSPVITGNCVNGRVTVASNNDVIVGDNLDYVQTGDDVLGLIAANDVIVAQWAPYNLNWRAAVLAQTGARHSASSDGSHGTAVFTGSTTSNGSPFMDMFQTRVYNYDASLQYLEPPWFPTIDYAYTVLLYRELPAP
jgi:Tfp pilus assembly protein PilX